MAATITVSISKKLKALRVKHQLSQEKLARVLGISQPAYNKIEMGITSVSVEYLLKLTEFYGLSIYYFLE